MKKYKTRQGQEIELDPSKPLTDEQFTSLANELDSSSLEDVIKNFSFAPSPRSIITPPGRTVEPGGRGEIPEAWGREMPKRLAWGALNALGHGASSGFNPIVMGLGGVSGFALPPQTKGEAAADIIAMIPGAKFFSKIPGVNKMPWLAGATGAAGEYAAGDAARQYVDTGEVEANTGMGVGSGISGILGGMFGRGAAAARKSSPVQEIQLRDSAERKISTMLDIPGAKVDDIGLKGWNDSAESLRGIFGNANGPRRAAEEALVQQRKLAAAKMRNTQVAQRESKVAGNKQGDAIDVAMDRLRADSINLKRDVNNAKVDLAGIRKYGIDPKSGKRFEEVIPAPNISDDDVFEEFVSKFSDHTQRGYRSIYKALKGRGMSSFEVSQAFAGMGDTQGARAFARSLAAKDKTAALRHQRMVGEAKAAAQKETEDKINKLIDLRAQNEIKRLDDVGKVITGVASDPALQTATRNSKAVQQRALELGVDLEKEKIALNSVKEAITENKRQKMFANPAVNRLLQPGTKGVFNDETLVKNISEASTEDIRGFMKEFATKPEVQGSLRNTYVLNLLRTSYDPQIRAFDFGKMTQSTDYSKLRELFGGGQSGETAAQGFRDFMEGVDLLQKVAQRNQALSNGSITQMLKKVGTTAGVGALAILPTGFLFHMPYKQAAMVGGGISFLHLPFNQKLVDTIAASPQFGKQFLKWAETGGSQNALSLFPVVNGFFKENVAATTE